MAKTNNPAQCPICNGTTFKYDSDIEGKVCQRCGATILPAEEKK